MRRCAKTNAAWPSSASTDHALKERYEHRITMKIGAALIRMGKPEEAVRFFDRALESFDARVAKGADDPYTRYYIACLLALRGDDEKALDVLERVHSQLPALTAAPSAARSRPRRPARSSPFRSNHGALTRRSGSHASLVTVHWDFVPVQFRPTE